MRQTRKTLGTIAALGLVGFTLGALGSAGCGQSDENRIDTSTGNATGPATWTRRIGADGAQVGWLVRANGAGNIVVVGTAEGTSDLGAVGKLQAKTNSDIFVAWLDKDGTITRASAFGETGYHVPIGAALDGQGGVIVSGLSGGDIDFGGGTLTNAGSIDAFLASIGPNGQYRFALHAGGAGMENGGEVAVDSAGNIIWTGSFEGTLNLGGITLTSKGETDVFVAKVDPTGKVSWARSLGGTGFEGDQSVIVDKKGRILVAGYYEGALDLGPGAQLPDTGQSDGQMLVALNGADGKVVYARGMPNAQGYFPFVMTSAEDGVYLVGELAGSIDAFGKTISTPQQGIAIAKIDDTGAAQMATVFAAEQPGHVYAVPQKGGGIVLSGHFEGSVTFNEQMKGAGQDDIFLAWIGSEGKVSRAMRIGGPGRERLGDIVVLSSGEVVMTGAFDGTLDIGGGAPHTSMNGPDAFIAMFR